MRRRKEVEPHEAMTGQRRHLEFGPILALHTQEWTDGAGLSSYIMGFQVPGSRVFASEKKEFLSFLRERCVTANLDR